MMSWFRCLNFNLSKKMIFIKQKEIKKRLNRVKSKKKFNSLSNTHI